MILPLSSSRSSSWLSFRCLVCPSSIRTLGQDLACHPAQIQDICTVSGQAHSSEIHRSKKTIHWRMQPGRESGRRMPYSDVAFQHQQLWPRIGALSTFNNNERWLQQSLSLISHRDYVAISSLYRCSCRKLHVILKRRSCRQEFGPTASNHSDVPSVQRLAANVFSLMQSIALHLCMLNARH